jgi:sugar phosphate isomerase/epimerase
MLPPEPTAPPILISLGAFGATEVRRHGQAGFIRLAAQAGADGVEVRGELLTGARDEFDELRAALANTTLQCVYSSPEGLWNAEGALDSTALQRSLAAAGQLQATRLKLSIGGFGPASVASLSQLQTQLSGSTITLLIENDQTLSAGTLPALRAFFAAADAQALPLGMTFDMGNWHWQGECPLQAAHVFAPRVQYVHCKGVQRQPQRWVAVPLTDSAAPWRALLRALPADVPWAIEYPLVGDDLLSVTRTQLKLLRGVARGLA